MSVTSQDDDMKAEYNFSKGERGRFYNPDTILHIPVYLDPDVEQFIRALAQKTGQDTDQLVNEWLRNSISIVQSAVPAQ